ncbi:MAG TPA: shikimate kinase [Candidatus Limnocylindria bacterium]|nr:shikimate kinase [Candidatus Limnocylindria bacterium]
MRRVSVIGTSSGAGKTTLGRKLADRLGVSFIELDALFWQPGWQKAPIELFRRRVAEHARGDGWVIDGNYTGRLGDLVWQRADTVVWLDLPLRVSLWRTFRRALEGLRSGEELWPGTGNRQTVRNLFFERDSVLYYAIRSHRRRRRLFEDRLRSGNYGDLAIHRFRSSADAEGWLASI